MPAWVALGAAVWLRRRALGGVALAVVVLQLVLVWPMVRPASSAADDAADDGATLRLRSFNVYLANDRLDEVATELLDGQVDVIALVEATPPVVEALDDAGVAARYPYRIDRSAFGTIGTVVLSRRPIELVGTPTPALLVARVDGGAAPDATVLVVHAFPPSGDDPGSWVRTLDDVDAAMAGAEGPSVAIGDFNATLDHRAYRDLSHDGRTDAHVATGRGSARSWPAGHRVPPLLLIDRAVLSPELQAVRTEETTVAGSDHRMIDVVVRHR